MDFNMENMNSMSNINRTYIRDKNGKKVYLFDKIRVHPSNGRAYDAHCEGFCVRRGELVVKSLDDYFFTPDHIEKL